MRATKLPRFLNWFIALAMLLSALCILVVDRGQAESQRGELRSGDKISAAA